MRNVHNIFSDIEYLLKDSISKIERWTNNHRVISNSNYRNVKVIVDQNREQVINLLAELKETPYDRNELKPSMDHIKRLSNQVIELCNKFERLDISGGKRKTHKRKTRVRKTLRRR